MLDKRVAQYFQGRDRQNPNAQHNRHYFHLMFAIAEGVLKMRKRQGLTQQELAIKLQTTQSTIARWETAGYSGYTLKKLFEIAEQLGHTLDINFVKASPIPTYDQKVEDDWGDPKLVRKEIKRRSYAALAPSSQQATIKKEVNNDQTYMGSAL